MIISIVVAMCTAEAYDLKRLLTSFSPVFPGTFKMSEDVIYVKIPRNKEDGDFSSHAEVFVFSDGCCVLWGAQRDISVLYSTFKEKLKPFERKGNCDVLFFFFVI